MKQGKRWRCWLIAIGICSLLWGAIFLWGDLSYAGNDDAGILRAFMGYQTGKAPTFHIFLHALLTYPLGWLSNAFPGVAWFSVLQIALLWLAGVVTVKSLMQRSLGLGKPLWHGLAAGCLYLAVYGAAYWVHPTFTVTAALLGAAAVAQIFSIDYLQATDGQVLRSMALALALVALCYALRQMTALPALAFCGLSVCVAAALYFGKGKRSFKPLLLTVLMVALVMGGLCAQREWEIDHTGSRDYLAWQEASGNVMDYTAMDNVSDETLSKLTWSHAEYRLVNQWYFLDENISTEAFDTIYAEEKASQSQDLGARLGYGLETLAEFFRIEGTALYSFGLTGLLLALCWVGLLFQRGKKAPLALSLLATLALCLAMLLYLALRGRLPLRAALMPMLPATVIALMLLPACWPVKPRGAAKATFALCGLCCLALAAAYLVPTAASCVRPAYDPDAEGEQSFSADLDEYALENPDYLVIYDFSLVMDRRMFPDTSLGIPQNVMFWGGWALRSPENLAQMAAYGIDGQHFTPADFLRENVCLASGVLDPPVQGMLEYLQAALGPDIDYSYEGYMGNVHIFTFYNAGE